MKKITKILYKIEIMVSITLAFSHASLAGGKGIVIVPIADLTGQPIQTYYSHQPLTTAYQKLPWAHFRNDYDACPRVHQLLYHEIVDIIGTRNDEMLIKIPNIFYQTMADARPQSYYWTLKKNILPFKKLSQKAIDSAKIPQPIYCNQTNEACYNDTVTLIDPFTESSIDMSFSAGTRFIKTKEQPYKDKVMVYVLHPKTHNLAIIGLPLSSVYIFNIKTMNDRIGDFLAILRRWAKQDNGIIPYVWGGCSFTGRHSTNTFTKETVTIQGKKLSYYMRPDYLQVPKAGYDCSSIIARAAQIVGLPYYYKNTYTIANHLPSLSPTESIKEGDLIWIRGHVLVVANVKEQTIIEASAYDYGYGEIHELPISKVFKGIETFDDLIKRYHHKKVIERLHANGTVLDTYKEVKLLKLASQFK